MELTVVQVAASFDISAQMIPHESRIQLKTEGTYSPGDLSDFEEESISNFSNNLMRPGGRVLDMTFGADSGSIIPVPPFAFG